MTHLLKQETSTLNSPGKYLYKQFTYSTNSVAVWLLRVREKRTYAYRCIAYSYIAQIRVAAAYSAVQPPSAYGRHLLTNLRMPKLI